MPQAEPILKIGRPKTLLENRTHFCPGCGHGVVHRLIAEKGWQCRELRHTVGSLEDFFVQVTYQQNMQQAEKAAG